MREHEREYPRDDAFEALLAQSVDELPPEEIVADVTPWRRAMERVLFGLALCMVTLNFWCLNYLLPAIGTVLLLLGFRALRRENPWLGGCFVCAVLRTACVFPSLILNTTILPGDACRSAAAAVSAALMLALLLCFWQGLLAVQKKAGLPAQTGGTLALIVWYVLICVLAAVHYTGLLVPIAMLVGYVCILRSLFRLRLLTRQIERQFKFIFVQEYSPPVVISALQRYAVQEMSVRPIAVRSASISYPVKVRCSARQTAA